MRPLLLEKIDEAITKAIADGDQWEIVQLGGFKKSDFNKIIPDGRLEFTIRIAPQGVDWSKPLTTAEQAKNQ
jgi:hypothetical protein